MHLSLKWVFEQYYFSFQQHNGQLNLSVLWVSNWTSSGSTNKSISHIIFFFSHISYSSYITFHLFLCSLFFHSVYICKMFWWSFLFNVWYSRTQPEHVVLHKLFFADQNPPVRHTETFSAKQVSIIKAVLSEPRHAKRNMLLELATNSQQGKKNVGGFWGFFHFLKHSFDFNN